MGSMRGRVRRAAVDVVFDLNCDADDFDRPQINYGLSIREEAETRHSESSLRCGPVAGRFRFAITPKVRRNSDVALLASLHAFKLDHERPHQRTHLL